MKKKRLYDHPVELIKTFDKKEERKYSDRDNFDYFWIKELESLFGDTDNDNNYYKPILVKTFFKDGYNIMKTEEIKTKIISKAVSLHDYAIFKWFNKWS